METAYQVRELLNSYRWNQIVDTTAKGLLLHLVLRFPDLDSIVAAPTNCLLCPDHFPDDARITEESNADYLRNGINDFPDHPAASFILQEGIEVLVWDCPGNKVEVMPLAERAEIARQLLTCFQSCFLESIDGEQRSIELSTLRQMNHIVLALFGGDNHAIELALDLILSALIILLDAQGSWLEYYQGSETKLLIKGDRLAVEEHLRSQQGNVMKCSIQSKAKNLGILGVLGSMVPEQTASLLPLMSQECLIVLEIERLFNLLKTQLAQVLGAIDSAIILVDQYGIISYVNSSAEQLLTKDSAATPIGKSAYQIAAPWSRSLESRTIQTVKGQKDRFGTEPEIWLVDWRVFPLCEADSTLGWLVLVDNRTEYYHWQEVGRQAERFATIATIISPLAHELRNPLAAAKGLLQLMGRKSQPEKVAEYHTLLVREIDRMSNLLNDFLLLGKTTKLNSEPTDLAALIQEIMPLLQAQTDPKKIEVSTEFDPVPAVIADRGHLTQVILNLVRNAVEAIENNGQICIGLHHHPKGVVLNVQDDGPGIKPDLIDKIFEPFFSTKDHGTGLGLSMVKAIVNQHGGKITATNRLDGSGTIFSIHLPAAMNTNPAIHQIDIILACSDELTCYAIEQALRAADLLTVVTTSLAEATLLAAKYSPSIILVEQNTPNLKELPQIKQVWPQAKILIIGQSLEDSNHYEDLQFIANPLDYALLIDKVQWLTNAH